MSNKLSKPLSLSSKEENPMSEGKEEQVFVRVKDRAGNEFVCPIDALKGLKEVTEEILDNCVDDATVGRYAGNIKIKS
jgi:DNA gyrase/topoisomerase IV subunit B